MTVVSCPGCGRRLDAAIATCPDCKTVLRKEQALSPTQQAQRQRAQEAEARFRANAAASRQQATSEAADDKEQKEPTFGERFAQARQQRLAEERQARYQNVQSVIITGVDIPLSELFVLSFKVFLVAWPALLLATGVTALLVFGLMSWLKVVG